MNGMNPIEKEKITERLDFSIELLKKRFPNITIQELIKESCEMARTLFVRSEIAFSGRNK